MQHEIQYPLQVALDRLDNVYHLSSDAISGSLATAIEGVLAADSVTSPVRSHMTDPLRPAELLSGVRIAARMLIEHRDRMARLANDTRAAARAAGQDIDTRIDYAEGSAAAYSVAGAILAGALGAASVQELAGADWSPPREPLPPMLPEDAAQVAPDDRIARAAVRVADGTILDETRPEPRS